MVKDKKLTEDQAKKLIDNPELAHKDPAIIAALQANGKTLESDQGFFSGMWSDIVNGARGLVGLNDTSNGAIDAQTGNFEFRTCFVAGTKVKTPSGYRNIEDIRAGDKVLSYNEHTKRLEVQTVAQTFIRKTDRIYTLVYDTGTKLQTTATHPFYIEGKGWVKAADLHVGDDSLLAGEVSPLDIYGGARLQNVSYRHSKQGVIVGITVEDRAETVYNFEVNETHTYLVGESDVVVHNDRYSQESKAWFNGHSAISYKPSGSIETIQLEKKVGPGGKVYFEGKKGDRYITLEVTDGEEGLVENEWETNKDGSRGKKIPSGRDAHIVALSAGDKDSQGEASWNKDTLKNVKDAVKDSWNGAISWAKSLWPWGKSYETMSAAEIEQDLKTARIAGATNENATKYKPDLKTRLAEHDRIKDYSKTGDYHQYCDPVMCKLVVDVADNLPKDQNLYINDLSLPQGQKTNWHGNGSSGWNGTHNNGLGIDVKMPTTDGNAAPGGMTYTSSSYSREKTIDLIKNFATNKPEGYNTVVLFNDPQVRDYFQKNPVKGLTVAKRPGTTITCIFFWKRRRKSEKYHSAVLFFGAQRVGL